MDADRFDRIARSLGGVRNRRAALQAAFGGVLGGLAAMTAGDADAKNTGGKGKGKGKNKPTSRSVGCDEYGESCHSPQDCCDKATRGVVCQNPAGGDSHGPKTCNCPGLNDGGNKPDFNNDPENCGKCGTKCSNGQICRAGKCVTPCVPKSPAETCDGKCGRVRNNCGDYVDCPDCGGGKTCSHEHKCYCPKGRDGECGAQKICCPADQKCVDGKCVGPCKPENPAETCAGGKCGEVKNNCGDDVNCGNCKNGFECNNQNHTCTCPAPRVSCGSVCCAAGQKCEGNKCVTPCVPETDQEACDKAGSVCGTVKNNCGEEVNCGACQNGYECKDNKTCVCPAPRQDCKGTCCPTGKVCQNNECVTPCVPKTRPEVCTAGVCGEVSDGCGGTIDCGTGACGSGNVCQNNQCVCPGGNAICNGVCCPSSRNVCNATSGACCTRTTTTCPANTCGSVDDGCGRSVECPACPAGQTCQGNTCVVVACATAGQACSGITACCANLECQGGICGQVDPQCAPRGKSCTDNPCCNSKDTCESNSSGTVNICKQVPDPKPNPKPDDPKCAKNGERPRNGAKCCGRLHENHGRCRTNRWERCNKADHRQPNCGCDRVTRCKHDRRGGDSCQGR